MLGMREVWGQVQKDSYASSKLLCKVWAEFTCTVLQIHIRVARCLLWLQTLVQTHQRTHLLNMPEEARTCEAWFQLTFRPQKWNLKAHMWYQLSPFPSSNVAICDAAPPRQHSPILRYSALLRYSATPCYVLIQVPNVIDTISKRWRSKKAFNTSLSHVFS